MLRLLFVFLLGVSLYFINNLVVRHYIKSRLASYKIKVWFIYSLIFSISLSSFAFWKTDFLSIGVGNEIDLMNEFQSVNIFFNSDQLNEYENCYKNNFIYIDVSGEYKIISDSTRNVVISDRNSISNVLNSLATNMQWVDMVILDMYFIKKSGSDSIDSLLKKAIEPF